MKTILLPLLFSFSAPLFAATPETAALALNALGLDLQKQTPEAGNVCLSPFSIHAALAMTYLGASGGTQEEMAHVLHFPADKERIAESFAALVAALDDAQEASAKRVQQSKKFGFGGHSEAMKLHMANRLFGQSGYEFRKPFLSAVDKQFGAPMEFMNFVNDHAESTRVINGWVAKQTNDRIRNLIPSNGLSEDTRLVLVNALYFKAAWETEFRPSATTPAPFHPNGAKQTVDVPTMSTRERMSYYDGIGFQAVTLPYEGRDLHFLLIVPDSINGVSEVEAKLTPETLRSCAQANPREVILHLPKFKITPPTMPLGEVLQRLGMNTAFDVPRGSADFDAMASRKADDYLYISKVFHKTFLELDEKGTEAAAATAVSMESLAAVPMAPNQPIEIKADRPFLFAIQHASSGACLFFGRVSDP